MLGKHTTTELPSQVLARKAEVRLQKPVPRQYFYENTPQLAAERVSYSSFSSWEPNCVMDASEYMLCLRNEYS